MDQFAKLKTLFYLLALCMSATTQAAQNSQAAVRFEEIAAKAGIRVQHHTRVFHGKNADVLHMFTSGGAAAAVGAYDNDGFADIFVADSDTGKPNHLFHNNGYLTFTDAAGNAGAAAGNDPLSGVSACLCFGH